MTRKALTTAEGFYDSGPWQNNSGQVIKYKKELCRHTRKSQKLLQRGMELCLQMLPRVHWLAVLFIIWTKSPLLQINLQKSRHSHIQLTLQRLLELTGRSMRKPIGTTDAKSVNVLWRTFFSLSVNSSPIRTLLSNPKAAATSMARSCVPCQTSCL